MSDARMSVAEYRVWAETRPDHERWELLDGEPVLMSPPKARHQRIVTNLLGALDALARRKGCDTYPGLAILSAAMDDFCTDSGCRRPLRGPMPPDGYVDNPLLVAEVLSPSTISNDRGRKSDFYRSLASLRSVLIVYQNEPRIELWRQETGWTMEVFGFDDVIELSELNGAVAVADIYARVTF